MRSLTEIAARLKERWGHVRDKTDSDTGACWGGIAGGCDACEICRMDEAVGEVVRYAREGSTVVEPGLETREVFRRVDEVLSELAGPHMGYGFYRPEDPRDFHPDPECTTEAERTAHAEAVAAWEAAGGKPEGWDPPKGSGWEPGPGGAPMHVLRAPWGIGSYQVVDREMEKLRDDFRAALNRAPKETRAPRPGEIDAWMREEHAKALAREANRAPGSGQGWSSMESAPRDGTVLLLGWAGRKWAHPGAWRDGYWTAAENGDHDEFVEPPTHWMPLEAAPGSVSADSARPPHTTTKEGDER